MAVNLKGRSFLTLMAFSPEEVRYLLDLARDLKAKKRMGVFNHLLKGKNIVLLFEKTRTRTRCAFEVARAGGGGPRHLPGFRQFPGGQEGIPRGQCQGAGPVLRRHRIPRLPAGSGGGPGQDSGVPVGTA